MDKDTIPQAARPRLNLYTKALRRERIFSSCSSARHTQTLRAKRE